MVNGKQIIDENTDPKIAQAIIGERLEEMRTDIKSIHSELKDSRDTIATVKFLLGGFWALTLAVLTALWKAFSIKAGA